MKHEIYFAAVMVDNKILLAMLCFLRRNSVTAVMSHISLDQ